MHTASALIDGASPEDDTRVVALVRKASHSVCIFADPSLTKFSLVGAEDFAVPLGMRCIGAVGFVDGAPRAALTEDLDETTIAALTTACVAQLVAVLERCAGLTSNSARPDA